MANRGLGSLTLNLIAQIGGFTGPLSKAERELNKRLKGMEGLAQRFGKTIGTALGVGIVAVTAAAGASVAAIKSAINAMDDMSKAAQRANLPTDQFSQLAYAAELADVSVEDLSGALGKLAKAQGEALKATSDQARAFKALGIEAFDPVTKQLTNTRDVFLAFADQFEKFKGSPEIVAVGMKLFGRSFQTLIPLLKDGADGLRAAAEEADRYGFTVSQVAGEQAEQFNDELTRLGAIGRGVARTIAAELLPELNEAAGRLKKMAEDGDLASNAVTLLSAALRLGVGALEGYNNAVERLSIGIELAVNSSAGLQEMQRNIQSFGFASGNVADGYKKVTSAFAEGQAQLDNLIARQNKVVDSRFSDVVQRVNAPGASPAGDLSALSLALGDRPKSAKAKYGKSDAEKEAEKVARAIEQMTKAQQDWQNELNQTGNPIADEYASRLREITEQAKGFAEEGVPAEKVKAFTDEMQKLATSLRDSDIAEFQEEFNEATDQMAASMQGPMQQALLDYQVQLKAIDKLLKLGIITLDEYNARLAVLTQQRDSPVTGMLDAIREEIMLLGMTNEEQEIYNNLKRAGAEAGSAAEQAIIAETKALQAFREEAAFLDDLKLGLSDMFVDFVSGAKTAKEAFGDFADAIYARALQFAADKAIQALFDAFSGPKQSSASAGSSTGGGWAGFFSSILSAFGGGKASGGGTQPGMFYRVNERGPELATINGVDYLMMGANSGRITPNHQLSGAGAPFNQVNNFTLPRRMDNRSEMQIRQAAGEGAREAIRRNGR